MQNDEHLVDAAEEETADEQAMSEDETVGTEPAGQDEQPSTDGVEDMEKELEAAKARAEENWNKVLQLMAEQENMRKRSQRDIENAHKYALEKFVDELLPVVDSLEMGLVAASEARDADKLREGTELTLKMFLGVLEKFGVEQIDPTGEKFDPEHHQAMTMQENPELEPNTVISTMQKGYLLNGRLIRPAMVIVSK